MNRGSSAALKPLSADHGKILPGKHYRSID